MSCRCNAIYDIRAFFSLRKFSGDQHKIFSFMAPTGLRNNACRLYELFLCMQVISGMNNYTVIRNV